MRLDKILLIPYLSKELDLIGYKTLPFKFKRKVTSRWTRAPEPREEDDSTETDSETENEPLQIIFNSRKMICSLVDVAIQLVDQIKTHPLLHSNDQIDKLHFENLKLEKQLNGAKKDLQKELDELTAEKNRNRLLQEKIDELERKLKESQMETKKSTQRSVNEENVLRHRLKKQEANIKELHTILWKQFNMVDKTYYPENFDIIQARQPDFSKLWSQVRYSRPATREDSLKKAVCILQENNNLLMEDVGLLKHLLIITLDEVNNFVRDISEKMKMTEKSCHQLTDKANELFDNVDELRVDAYKEMFRRQFAPLRRLVDGFEEASFTVYEDLFVCWSDVIKRYQSIDDDA